MLKHWANGDPAHLDPLLSSNANVVNFVSPFAYPRLMKWAPGTYPKTADGSIEGFAAESYEISPDKLQHHVQAAPGHEVGLARADQRPPASTRRTSSSAGTSSTRPTCCAPT